MSRKSGMKLSPPVNVEFFYPYAPTGSVSAHIVSAVSSMLSGKAPGDLTQLLYSSPGVRNTSAITSALDLSAYAASGYGGSPVLVTQRHVIWADHTGNKTSVTFVKNDGGNVVRNIVSSYLLVRGEVPEYDIRVGLLESAIPSIDVEATVIPPGNIISKLPGGSSYSSDVADQLSTYYLPNIFIKSHKPDQTSASFLSIVGGEMFYHTSAGDDDHYMFDTAPGNPAHPEWDGWCSAIISGDSGGACIWPVNGKACFMGLLRAETSAGRYGVFYMPTFHKTTLDAQMRNLAIAYDGDATAYALTEQDWTGFTTV